MPSLETLFPYALIALTAAFVLAGLRLFELLLDFAEERFAEDGSGNAPYGDVVALPDDLKTSFHAETNSLGGQRKNVA